MIEKEKVARPEGLEPPTLCLEGGCTHGFQFGIHVRPIYEDFELAKLSRAYTLSEEVRFKFYLMSGFRDAEGRFVNRLAESATLGPANAHARCQGAYQS